MLEINRADRAEELFREGYNCSQSVFAAFADVLGLTVEQAALESSAFGGGVGGMREICGAVSGMVLLVGRLCGYSDPKEYEGKKAMYHLIQEMSQQFEQEMGSIICRDLLGIKKGESLPEPSVRTEEYYQQRPCVKACRVAAKIASEMLEEQA